MADVDTSQSHAARNMRSTLLVGALQVFIALMAGSLSDKTAFYVAFWHFVYATSTTAGISKADMAMRLMNKFKFLEGLGSFILENISYSKLFPQGDTRDTFVLTPVALKNFKSYVDAHGGWDIARWAAFENGHLVEIPEETELAEGDMEEFTLDGKLIELQTILTMNTPKSQGRKKQVISYKADKDGELQPMLAFDCRRTAATYYGVPYEGAMAPIYKELKKDVGTEMTSYFCENKGESIYIAYA